MIDTGANKNFISHRLAAGCTTVHKPFSVQSAGGNITITHRLVGKFFEPLGNDLDITFFVLPNLQSFDGIIGDDTLKDLKAIIDRKNNCLTITPGIKIPLLARASLNVNSLLAAEHPDGTQETLNSLLEEFYHIFEPPSPGMSVETAVKAEIRTNTQDPIYTKSYPYPVNMRGEVERQIDELLQSGIIRPSNSPYNSPIWVVPKKPKPNGEKQYRMVVDFKRLNAVTISDTYPIPDINATLASLGNAKYFTTLDLTSGFHQIHMKDSDIPKTAFSTLNGKYEFLRLPFGLKNAPAIFQRMIDDVLREHIGKVCYVYIDDIIVFSGDYDTHWKNLRLIFASLSKANLQVNLEKSHFLDTQVEFLGYVVTADGIKADPKKVKAIGEMPPPTSVKELKRFLGMTSYYRKFIQDYAKVAKPLTNLTRGLYANIKSSQSSKVPITLDETAMQSFKDLKSILSSSEILAFPCFTKPFHLTTDASNYAIGAVLSQDDHGKDRPLAYISRSLNKTEENYATVEKEMLAIVWALDNLRAYLYGAGIIRVYTDHQPLTFALGNRNFNAKLKRWKARIEEYNCELIYKPGKSNVVADALSRIPPQINQLGTDSKANPDDDMQSLDTAHSASHDSSKLIPHVESPINVFKNQLIFDTTRSEYLCEYPHPGYTRHLIPLNDGSLAELTDSLQSYLRPVIINGVKIPEEHLQLFQSVCLASFLLFKIRITQRLVADVADAEEICEIIEKEHRRAHRGPSEIRLQLLERYYFPRMSSTIRLQTSSCHCCKLFKYDRHLNRPNLQPTPIPNYPCEILHIDIFMLEKRLYLSCIDKFSKFAKLFHLQSKASVHLRETLVEALHYFTAPKVLVSDNERGLLCPTVLNYLRSLDINLYYAPTQKSEVNGQVERFHSTFLEIYRCLKTELPTFKPVELVPIAVDRYNTSVHSVTNRKPADIFFDRSSRINYQGLTDFRQQTLEDIRGLIEHKQTRTNMARNKARNEPKSYEPGDEVFVANKQIKTKEKPRFRAERVQEDNKVTIRTRSGKTFHKTDLRN